MSQPLDQTGAAAASAKPQGALQGLKVVSMAEQYPGPFCTLILTDMGADVIQIERPGQGDPARFLTGFYEALNRGKRSRALDIRQPEDKAQLIALLREADVFLEGFRPGKLAKQGLGYDDLRKVNPGLIYCSISGYGQDGPYRDRPGHDLSLQGVGGALDERLSGAVNGLPPALLLGDTASALYTVIGVLSALLARHRTGQGTYVDIAMSDSVTAAMTAFLGLMGDNEIAPPQAEPAYDLFICADGTAITLSIAHEDSYWQRLCDDLGLAEHRNLSRPERVARRNELHHEIATIIAAEPRSHWASLLEASDQMWGPANRLEDLPNDPQVVARGLLERLARADGQEQWVVRQPVKFSAWANSSLTRAPGLDEHHDEGFER